MIPSKPLRAFISYSRTDQQFAIRLTSELKSAGFLVWMDQFDIPTGSRWDDEIEKALMECQIFLFIMTPASITSMNAKDEMGFAIDHDKHILPVLLEKCEVPLRLRRMQYVDFTQMSFDEGIERAKELLSRLVQEIEASSSSTLTPEDERSAYREPATMPTRKGGVTYPQPGKYRTHEKNNAKRALAGAGVGILAIGTLAIAVWMFKSVLFPPVPIATSTWSQIPSTSPIPTNRSTSTIPSDTQTPKALFPLQRISIPTANGSRIGRFN